MCYYARAGSKKKFNLHDNSCDGKRSRPIIRNRGDKCITIYRDKGVQSIRWYREKAEDDLLLSTSKSS